MILKFKYGFIFEDFTYGWYEQELYRLPSTSADKKTYGLKKLTSILVGNKVGYRIKRQKFTIEQLKGKTIFIDKEYQVINDSVDIP
jgi:hypothetical protein